ncbi:hypothetical protein P154DRAFT_562190 [Amniculicola lignicola CBS 123094]|uniref:Chromodomain-helicase-DNA-binding protein 1-like C-terminal domain-containing protein n=1 Tax=Amniculicola lignicola CBS 123094 TaxID=1392246 RepID=A0A6A5WPF5_9PLEO|nr:hypothetical protein P154DRAFT_562190 [Amniculicola lignicola CBS 123094]
MAPLKSHAAPSDGPENIDFLDRFDRKIQLHHADTQSLDSINNNNTDAIATLHNRFDSLSFAPTSPPSTSHSDTTGTLTSVPVPDHKGDHQKDCDVREQKDMGTFKSKLKEYLKKGPCGRSGANVALFDQADNEGKKQSTSNPKAASKTAIMDVTDAKSQPTNDGHDQVGSVLREGIIDANGNTEDASNAGKRAMLEDEDQGGSFALAHRPNGSISTTQSAVTALTSQPKIFDPEAAALLFPMLDRLERLSRTIPSKMPPPHASIHATTYSTLLKKRLQPIGAFICELTKNEPNGVLELRLCKCIQENWWPLMYGEERGTVVEVREKMKESQSFEYLRIMEMYRNAIWKDNLQEQKEQKAEEQETEEKEKEEREIKGYKAAQREARDRMIERRRRGG